MSKTAATIVRAHITANSSDLSEAARLWRNPESRAAFEASQNAEDRHRDPLAPQPPRRVRVRAGKPEVYVSIDGRPDYWQVDDAGRYIVLTAITPSPLGIRRIKGIRLPNESWLLENLTLRPFGTS